MLHFVKDDDELTAARLLEFFDNSTPWHRSLWNAGLVLSLRELLEASSAVRSGVLNENSLKSLGSTCLRLSGEDPGAGDESRKKSLQLQLKEQLRFDGLHYHTIRQLADDIEANYLERWAAAMRQSQRRPKPERIARAVAAHLLDLGFNSNYLHRWWKFKLNHEPGRQTLADILEDAHAMTRLPLTQYEVLIVLNSSPRTKSGYPKEWLDAAAVSQWLRKHSYDPAGLRPSGGIVLPLQARDPEAAARMAEEVIDGLSARASVAIRDKIVPAQYVWVAGAKEPYPLAGRLRGVRVRALYREDRIYPPPSKGTILDAAIELLSHLERSSPSAAVAGGWAAIEALLSEPNDRGAAAERLAELVACSFPRAELTVLSYKLENPEPRLATALLNCKENRERARVLGQWIQDGSPLQYEEPSHRAALARMKELLKHPRMTLERIKTHVMDAFNRLYRQRNLVLHSGKTDAVALRASLRTSAPLVGAGIDRIAHAWYVQGLRPIELAARAKISLATLTDGDVKACLSLLD